MKSELSLPSHRQSIQKSIRQYSRKYASYATFHPCGYVSGRMTPLRGGHVFARYGTTVSTRPHSSITRCDAASLQCLLGDCLLVSPFPTNGDTSLPNMVGWHELLTSACTEKNNSISSLLVPALLVSLLPSLLLGPATELILSKVRLRSPTLEQVIPSNSLWKSWLTEVGIQVSPNSSRVLRKLGIDKYIERFCTEPVDLRMMRWEDGQKLVECPLKTLAHEEYGSPYW